MLHPLHEAVARGVPILTFNPLRERGLERFTDPQSPAKMLTGTSHRISSQYLQVKAGGDIAALMALCKFAIEADDDARRDGAPAVLDHAFLAEHTTGFEAHEVPRGFESLCEAGRVGAPSAELRRSVDPSGLKGHDGCAHRMTSP